MVRRYKSVDHYPIIHLYYDDNITLYYIVILTYRGIFLSARGKFLFSFSNIRRFHALLPREIIVKIDRIAQPDGFNESNCSRDLVMKRIKALPIVSSAAVLILVSERPTEHTIYCIHYYISI